MKLQIMQGAIGPVIVATLLAVPGLAGEYIR